MISELYAIDEQLVSRYDNIITIGIQSKSGGVWNDPVPLDPSNIVSESLEIEQSICDDKEIKIGGCIPSQLTLSLVDIAEDLSGKQIVVTAQAKYYGDLYPSASLYPREDMYPNVCFTDQYVLFVGPIYSCKKTSNYRIRKLIAFDRLYYPSTILCKNRVYNYLHLYDPQTAPDYTFLDIMNWFFPKARLSFDRSGFINRNTVLFLNDTYWQDLADDNTTFLEFYRWLCELNGVFLIEDAPTEISSARAHPRVIFPYQNMNTVYVISSYAINGFDYDDFITKEIRWGQFKFNKSRRRVFFHVDPYEGYSRYYSDNPVLNSIADWSYVQPIIENLEEDYSTDHTAKITGNVYRYRPFKASIFNRWWVQVGDRIRLPTNDPEVPFVESIVLSRKIKGMYGLTVEIEAKGVEIMGKENDEEINE